MKQKGYNVRVRNTVCFTRQFTLEQFTRPQIAPPASLSFQTEIDPIEFISGVSGYIQTHAQFQIKCSTHFPTILF